MRDAGRQSQGVETGNKHACASLSFRSFYPDTVSQCINRHTYEFMLCRVYIKIGLQVQSG